jgi:hypothetical protein
MNVWVINLGSNPAAASNSRNSLIVGLFDEVAIVLSGITL